jgi:hypothetical protein
MAGMELDDIIAAIEGLDRYERDRIEAKLADLKGGNRSPLSREAQYVADALFDITRIHVAVVQLRKLQIDVQTIALYDWFGEQISGLNETQRCGLVLLCIRAIAAYYAARDLKADTKSLLDGLSDISRIMNIAYPGYWRSGLLPLLVPQAEPVL